MKRQCAIITVYKSPQMLEFLLDALHEKMDCVVYIDKRYSENFQKVKSEFPNVVFQEPFVVKWGGESISKKFLWD